MEHHQHQRASFWKTPAGIAATVFAVAASVYLYATHKDHFLAALPFLLLAACPLMHVFMHRGHGAADGENTASPEKGGTQKGPDGR